MSDYSENPELTPAILTELHTALLQRQADLQRQIADLRQNVSAPVDPLNSVEIDAPGDEGDASVDLQDREESDQLLLELHAQLADVEHALTKFDTGTYGICERCGRPIPLARLRVLPDVRPMCARWPTRPTGGIFLSWQLPIVIAYPSTRRALMPRSRARPSSWW